MGKNSRIRHFSDMVAVRLPSKISHQLSEVSERMGITKSSVVRSSLEYLVEHNEVKV